MTITNVAVIVLLCQQFSRCRCKALQFHDFSHFVNAKRLAPGFGKSQNENCCGTPTSVAYLAYLFRQGSKPTPTPTQSAIWRAAIGVTWQWQLSEILDSLIPAQVYDIDLFDNNAATAAKLHAQGRKVICYINATLDQFCPPGKTDEVQRDLEAARSERMAANLPVIVASSIPSIFKSQALVGMPPGPP